MKKMFAVALLMASVSAFAQVHVNGYFKKNGTYVQPHERTSPNNTNLDNYSTKGNVNPYTGEPGTKEPDSYGYQRPQPVQPVRPVQPIQPIQPPQPLQPITPQPSNQLIHKF